MTEKIVDKDLVRDLAELLHETSLNEIELSKGDFKIKVVRHPAPIIQPTFSTAIAGVPETIAAVDTKIASDAIKSPMVGNVYLSPRPGAEPFVKVGDTVEKGQTLLIIEAMKVMNPIPSPISGTVKAIFVQDSQPVEFNEPLIHIG